MREEISAGGVVLFGNAILLLRKYNGDWVLPKGKVEKNEEKDEAALREVLEESGVKGEIIKYLGEIHYTFKENWDENKTVHKTVFWYLMKAKTMNTIPQREEGFVDAKFIHINRVVDLAKYDDEKEIIKVALDEIKKIIFNLNNF
ncbi:NUDIX hydrolase [Tepidibacter hydrothermalis]|uniref:NUDIX hydrolase n=1 Tax=Tepidibacter hydrothermalis TaxID=3036126 RepID=A0ABY8ED25_9FIRM|nr:NUDIX hydrolase [Tepidibacter hydrothermalis]WFD10826.1 NUDIX hydrolase [Tepidibacter hydrothermalis]